MLKKLLKYDMKFNYKVLIIFYFLSLFFALLTRIFLSIEDSFICNIIGSISSGVTISMIFNIFINNILRLWVRFKTNFYSDESYLTHTLPVSKKTLYDSKIVSSVSTLFLSTIVIGISLFIAYFSKENLELVKNILLPLENIMNSKLFYILLAILFILFLEIANLLQTGYTGIILGHRMNNNKISFSFLFGFISYMISQTIILVFLFMIALFNKDFMNLFNTTSVINIDTIKTIIYLSMFSYTLILVITYFINLNLFKKGVNVD